MTQPLVHRQAQKWIRGCVQLYHTFCRSSCTLRCGSNYIAGNIIFFAKPLSIERTEGPPVSERVPGGSKENKEVFKMMLTMKMWKRNDFIFMLTKRLTKREKQWPSYTCPWNLLLYLGKYNYNNKLQSTLSFASIRFYWYNKWTDGFFTFK